MFRDFFFIHADVIRNSFVLLLLTLGTVLATALVTWRMVLTKAFREANQNIIQENVELRIRNQELRALQASHLATIVRLTVVQGVAVSSADAVKEIARSHEGGVR